MKAKSKTSWIVALFLLLVGLVPAAEAALARFSPNPARLNGVSVGGMPAWYMDQNGVAVEACLDVVNCGLIGLGDPAFNDALPLSYPTNFPSEAFYFLAQSGDINMGLGGTASVILALEFTFIDPVTGALLASPNSPGALGAPFLRQRIIQVIPGLAGATPPGGGDWVLTTPWGTTTFPLNSVKCVLSGGNSKCSSTIDLPAPGAIPPNFAAALGTGVPGSMSSFLKTVPPSPPGFLGTGVASISALTTAGTPVTITLTDTSGNTGSTGTFLTIIGKTVGLDVQPGANLNIGPATVGATTPPPFQTVTITNTTGSPILFPALALAGTDVADFTIAPPTAVAPATAPPSCSGATVAVGASCGFDVMFNPLAAPKAPRAATIAVAPTTVQPVPAPTPPLDNPPAVTMKITGTAQYPLTVAVTADAAAPGSGTIASTPAGIADCGPAGGVCTASFDIGSSVSLAGSAAATPPSVLQGFSGACVGATCTNLPMSGPQTVSASFIKGFNVTTNAAPAAGGSITASQVAASGSTPTVTITPNNCFHVAGLTDNGATVAVTPVAGTLTSTYQLPPLAADHALSATFSNILALTKAAGANGAILGEASANCGETKAFSIAPNPKFQVGSITLNGTAQGFTKPASAGGAVSLSIPNISADQSLSASFLPSGDLSGDGTLDIGDALKGMKILLGLQTATGDDTAAMDVAPLGADGKPQGDGTLDLRDVLVILKRVVNLVNW